jgi:hypothetical protein
MTSRNERPKTLSGRRFSTSSEGSRRAELERIRAMTALERMALALSLGRQRRALVQRSLGPVKPHG